LVWSRRAELAPVLKGCAAGQGPDCHAAGQLKYEGFTGASGLGEFARGCDLGWGPSCIKVADDERLRGSAVRASELTKKAEGLCDKGQSAACLARASAYFDGELAKGRNKAADDVWRGKAQALERHDCDGGDAVACRRLGEMFRDGTGGEESPTKSMEALKKACDGGDGDGCAMLSWAFTNGRSVPAEPARAVALALRGCSLGSKDSCYKLTSLLSRSDIGEEDRAMGTAALAQQCKLGKACYTP
jgi:TPR repeat protein